MPYKLTIFVNRLVAISVIQSFNFIKFNYSNSLCRYNSSKTILLLSSQLSPTPSPWQPTPVRHLFLPPIWRWLNPRSMLLGKQWLSTWIQLRPSRPIRFHPRTRSTTTPSYEWSLAIPHSKASDEESFRLKPSIFPRTLFVDLEA